MVAATCPSQETLLKYSVGLLCGEERDALDSHLDSCADCQATIVALDDGDDTVVGRLRMPLSGESLLAEPQLQEAMAAAMTMQLPVEMPQTLGEYQLLEELGRGGMGRVCKALHTKLDRVVAVKVLPRGLVGDRKASVRFEREMKAIGRLDHPHIVRAYDAREIDGQLVLAMEFVPGLDLAKIVRCCGRLAVPDACEIARQVALGLQAAHEHGLVHRDIKPSNMMLTPDGQVKVLDLGLARLHSEPVADDEMTGTGQAMGTADYMAPEQGSDSRTVDIRADIYSLGATLYKLLSGRAPFSGPEHQGALDKIVAHRQQPVPPIRQLCPAVPEELAAVLDRMLAKDPDARYSTPAEAASALAAWCDGADLSVLLQRAVKQSGERRGARGEAGRATGERGCGASSFPLPMEEGQGEGRRAPASRRWKSIVALILLLLLVGGFGFALGILVRIKHDGKETAIEVPDGSTARVGANGQVEITLPDKSGTALPAPQAPLPSNYTPTYNNPSLSYPSLGYSQQENYDQVIADCTRAIELDPKNLLAFYKRSLAYFQKGDYDRVIADCTRAIELDPKYALAYGERGSAYSAKKDYDKAIADCTRAVELDPKYVWAYGERGGAYFQKQDYDKAIADFTRGIELDPKYAWAHYYRSLAYFQKGDYDRVIADCTRAIELCPTYALAYGERGSAFSAKKDYDTAIADFTRAAELDPNYAWAYGERGYAYFEKQEYDRAIADCTRGIQLDPKYAWAYARRGAAYFAKNDYDTAIADCTRAVELDPKHAWAYGERGDAYLAKQDYDKAIADFTRGIELDPKYAWAHYKRGVAYFEKKDHASAKRDYVRAVEIDPNSPAKDRLKELPEKSRLEAPASPAQPRTTSSAVPDGAAIHGTWEVVYNNDIHLINSDDKFYRTLPDQDVTDQEIRRTTRIVITGDGFKIVGTHVRSEVLD